MSRIRTVEDGFDYNVKLILKEMYKEYQEIDPVSGTDGFSDYLWGQRKELGERFFERIDEYFGIDDIANELD